MCAPGTTTLHLGSQTRAMKGPLWSKVGTFTTNLKWLWLSYTNCCDEMPPVKKQPPSPQSEMSIVIAPRNQEIIIIKMYTKPRLWNAPFPQSKSNHPHPQSEMSLSECFAKDYNLTNSNTYHFSDRITLKSWNKSSQSMQLRSKFFLPRSKL